MLSRLDNSARAVLSDSSLLNIPNRQPGAASPYRDRLLCLTKTPLTASRLNTLTNTTTHKSHTFTDAIAETCSFCKSWLVAVWKSWIDAGGDQLQSVLAKHIYLPATTLQPNVVVSDTSACLQSLYVVVTMADNAIGANMPDVQHPLFSVDLT